jgi:S-disulfanyl-L-cysteine oxidoreductase SoxD
MSNRTLKCAAGAIVVVIAVWGRASAQSPSTPYDIGRTASADEIRSWGINVGPGGEGLPKGEATATVGRQVYLRYCARCHGPTGTEGPDDRLVGSRADLVSQSPRKTVGSYWPHATTLWDYVNRAMPFDQPGRLTVDEVYAVVAYVLYLNGLIGVDDPVKADTLPLIRMPNRDGFIPDPRPDVGRGTARRSR